MDYTAHVLKARNGEEFEIREFDCGLFACPVCGLLLPFPAYDTASGEASDKFCDSCNVQFGWDDMIPPDSPTGSLKIKWEELREDWIRDHAGNDVLETQLANIGAKL